MKRLFKTGVAVAVLAAAPLVPLTSVYADDGETKYDQCIEQCFYNYGQMSDPTLYNRCRIYCANTYGGPQ